MVFVNSKPWSVPRPRVGGPQRIPWETPPLKEIKVTARYEAIGAAQSSR